MDATDDDDHDVEEPAALPQESDMDSLIAVSEGQSEEEPAISFSLSGVLNWMSGMRSCMLIVGMGLALALFFTIMLHLRSEVGPAANKEQRDIRNLAVEMMGHEVKISDINQVIPMRGGKSMTVGLELVLILGQLPEERIEGAPRANAQEFALFISTIKEMEPAIRSRVNLLLQKVPPDSLGTVETYKYIKDDIMDYVNDTLEGLDFGKNVRKGISKRRVTDVLLPMFVRQRWK